MKAFLLLVITAVFALAAGMTAEVGWFYVAGGFLACAALSLTASFLVYLGYPSSHG